MGEAFVDTNIIIRLLTGDDLEQQQRAKRLFERIEHNEVQVTAPLTVIADAVYVLSSPKYYNVPRAEIVALLKPLLRLTGFRLRNRSVILQALEIYSRYNFDFTDAVIYAFMQQTKSKLVYSFDHDFDQLVGIQRQEP